jgi:hypothetical protein
MAATATLSTLSQVQTLDTAYLLEAAQYWTRTANLWEQAFADVHDTMSIPGGSPWKGRAAAAAQERSHLDLVKVREASDQLHGAAGLALRGDQQLQACKDGVLEAVTMRAPTDFTSERTIRSPTGCVAARPSFGPHVLLRLKDTPASFATGWPP